MSHGKIIGSSGDDAKTTRIQRAPYLGSIDAPKCENYHLRRPWPCHVPSGNTIFRHSTLSLKAQ